MSQVDAATVMRQPGSPASAIHLLRSITPFMKPYRASALAALGALLLGMAAQLSLPLALRRWLDQGLGARDAAAQDLIFVGVLAITAIIGVATGIRFSLVVRLGERVTADLRKKIYENIVTKSPTFFDCHPSGDILARLTNDTTLIQAVAGGALSVALRSALIFVGGLVGLTLTSVELTGLVLALLAITLTPMFLLGRRVRTLSRAAADMTGLASSIATETLAGIRTVQAFGLEQVCKQQHGAAIDRSLDAAFARTRAQTLLTALSGSFVLGGILTILWFGMNNLLGATLTPGQLGQFILYAVFVGSSFSALMTTWSQVQRATGAMERITELLDPTLDDHNKNKPFVPLHRSSGRARIEFRNITFHYPTRSRTAALCGISFAANPGEMVALVGASGAGKSTVFNLLLRYYDPDSGSILLDDVELLKIDPSDIRARIAVVAQETTLFAANVRENIRYGRLEASDTEVELAARHAAAHDFIVGLPHSYDTPLGERGLNLSGGQRQRIAIARAILRNPSILLLDEATSALDSENELAVQRAIEQLSADRTTIVIAHRLTTIQRANRIVLMDKGRVIASGTHADLLQSSPVYSRLVALQIEGGAGVLEDLPQQAPANEATSLMTAAVL